MNKLKEFLEEVGFRFHNSPLYIDNQCDWIAYKRTVSKRECTSNEKPVQIVVAYFSSTDAKYEGVEIDLTAEFNGIWWQLKAYSLSPSEAIEKLSEIESSLVKAWEAL
jgi:hypothetical protein